MDCKRGKIELYTVQTSEVMEIINRQSCYYVKLEFIGKKYESVKEVFLNAYHWYVQHATKYVKRPEEAESAVWTFLNSRYAERHPGCMFMKLQVPVEEAVFFRMSDWNKVLNLKYIGKSTEEEEEFAQTLERSGINYEGDVYQKPYYPQLKKRLVESWDNLFRYDKEIKQGNQPAFDDMQAGLWCIKKEWVVDTLDNPSK